MPEEILERRNLDKALDQVTRNKGSGGIDGMQTDELRGLFFMLRCCESPKG